MSISITKMSPNGQVVIPSDIRKDAGIGPKDKFFVIQKGRNILLKRVEDEDFEKDFKLFERVMESERQIRKGNYIEVDADEPIEEIHRKLTQ